MATHSSILAWRLPWTEELGRLYSPWGHKESDSTEQLSLHFTSCLFSLWAKISLGCSLCSNRKNIRWGFAIMFPIVWRGDLKADLECL